MSLLREGKNCAASSASAVEYNPALHTLVTNSVIKRPASSVEWCRKPPNCKGCVMSHMTKSD